MRKRRSPSSVPGFCAFVPNPRRSKRPKRMHAFTFDNPHSVQKATVDNTHSSCTTLRLNRVRHSNLKRSSKLYSASCGTDRVHDRRMLIEQNPVSNEHFGCHQENIIRATALSPRASLAPSAPPWEGHPQLEAPSTPYSNSSPCPRPCPMLSPLCVAVPPPSVVPCTLETLLPQLSLGPGHFEHVPPPSVLCPLVTVVPPPPEHVPAAPLCMPLSASRAPTASPGEPEAVGVRGRRRGQWWSSQDKETTNVIPFPPLCGERLRYIHRSILRRIAVGAADGDRVTDLLEKAQLVHLRHLLVPTAVASLTLTMKTLYTKRSKIVCCPMATKSANGATHDRHSPASVSEEARAGQSVAALLVGSESTFVDCSDHGRGYAYAQCVEEEATAQHAVPPPCHRVVTTTSSRSVRRDPTKKKRQEWRTTTHAGIAATQLCLWQELFRERERLPLRRFLQSYDRDRAVVVSRQSLLEDNIHRTRDHRSEAGNRSGTVPTKASKAFTTSAGERAQSVQVTVAEANVPDFQLSKCIRALKSGVEVPRVDGGSGWMWQQAEVIDSPLDLEQTFRLYVPVVECQYSYKGRIYTVRMDPNNEAHVLEGEYPRHPMKASVVSWEHSAWYRTRPLLLLLLLVPLGFDAFGETELIILFITDKADRKVIVWWVACSIAIVIVLFSLVYASFMDKNVTIENCTKFHARLHRVRQKAFDRFCAGKFCVENGKTLFDLGPTTTHPHKSNSVLPF